MGRTIPKEMRERISAKLKGRPLPEETKKKMSETLKKRPPMSEEWRKKISVALTGGVGHPMSEEMKKRLSERMSGEKNPFFGRNHSEEEWVEIKRKLKGRKSPMKGLSGELNPRYGTHHSLETKLRIADAQRGEMGNNWNGGTSFEPYCEKFNGEFKERVRAFFGYVCPECGTPQNGKRLHVHHVNFNKMTCCDNTQPLFVPLCASCHQRTQKNREYWKDHFTDMINGFCGGKSYFTREEFQALSEGGV